MDLIRIDISLVFFFILQIKLLPSPYNARPDNVQPVFQNVWIVENYMVWICITFFILKIMIVHFIGIYCTGTGSACQSLAIFIRIVFIREL